MKLRFQPHHTQRFRTAQPVADRLVTTLPVPGFRQTRSYTCGFATALMVLRYFGMELPAMELFRRLQTGRDGTRQSALIRELRAVGLRVNARYDVDFARVVQAIDRNKLIIGYLEDLEHWLVIYGYGLAPNRVYVADPRPDVPCEQRWDEYGPRLGGFGIICSHPQESTALRQTPLRLREQPTLPAMLTGLPVRRADMMASAPPTPVIQLRCEVRQAMPPEEAAEPTQLSFSFCA